MLAKINDQFSTDIVKDITIDRVIIVSRSSENVSSGLEYRKLRENQCGTMSERETERNDRSKDAFYVTMGNFLACSEAHFL